MLDSLSQTLAAGELPLDGLLVRSVPPDRQLAEEAAAVALADNDCPTIFLCRNEFYAEAAKTAGENAGLVFGKGFEVICGGHSPRNEAKIFPNVCSGMTLAEQVGKLSELLCASAKDTVAKTFMVPVEMQETMTSEVMPSGDGVINQGEVNK